MHNEELRLMFVDYLARGGVDTKASGFPAMVRTCLFHYSNLIKNVSDSEMALMIWNKAMGRINTATRLLQSPDIILIDEVPDAHSHKAFFEFVLVRGVPKVFKFPQHSWDSQQREIVLNDVRFCDIMLENHPIFPRGLVHYEQLSLPKANPPGTVVTAPRCSP